jgi:hypothetical protein
MIWEVALGRLWRRRPRCMNLPSAMTTAAWRTMRNSVSSATFLTELSEAQSTDRAMPPDRSPVGRRRAECRRRLRAGPGGKVRRPCAGWRMCGGHGGLVPWDAPGLGGGGAALLVFVRWRCRVGSVVRVWGRGAWAHGMEVVRDRQAAVLCVRRPPCYGPWALGYIVTGP